jgi:hypothetical protein
VLDGFESEERGAKGAFFAWRADGRWFPVSEFFLVAEQILDHGFRVVVGLRVAEFERPQRRSGGEGLPALALALQVVFAALARKSAVNWSCV